MLTLVIQAYPTLVCSLFGHNPCAFFILNIMTTINWFQAFAILNPTIYLSLNHEKARQLSLIINFVTVLTELTILFLKHGTLCGKGELKILEGLLNTKLHTPVMNFISLMIVTLPLAVVPKVVYMLINFLRKKPVSQHTVNISLKPRLFTRRFMPKSNSRNLNDVYIDDLNNAVDPRQITTYFPKYDNPAFGNDDESLEVSNYSSSQVMHELPILELIRNTSDTKSTHNLQEMLEILPFHEYKRPPLHKQR